MISLLISLSSGIGGIIIGWIATFLRMRKIVKTTREVAAKLQYSHIPKERSQWREDLRLLSIEYPNISELDKHIASLKTKLNPFKKEDNHLWVQFLSNETVLGDKCIGFFEHIERISLTLKEDWERSKNEIKSGNILSEYFPPQKKDFIDLLVDKISILKFNSPKIKSASETDVTISEEKTVYHYKYEDYCKNRTKYFDKPDIEKLKTYLKKCDGEYLKKIGITT